MAIHHFRFAPRQLIPMLLSILMLTSGCSQFITQDQSSEDDGGVESTTETSATPLSWPEPVAERPFDAETLADLLIGELAVYERDIEGAVKLYSSAAKSTLDAGVAQRAAQLSRYSRDPQKSLSAAELWYQLSPNDPGATENYAELLTISEKPLEAIALLKQQFLFDGGGNFGVLRSGKLNRELAPTMLDELQALNNRPHQNQSLRFTYAVLLQSMGQQEQALAQVAALRAVTEDSQRLATLESSLLIELNQPKKAAQVLKNALDAAPDSKSLRIEYARTLSNYDMPAAQQQFATLLKRYPRDITLLMAHALAAIENEARDEATQSLEQLLRMHRNTDFAHYHLGRIAHENQGFDKALEHLQQIKMGPYFSNATQLILDIYRAQDASVSAATYLSALRAQYPEQAVAFWVYEANYFREEDNLTRARSILDRAILALPEAKSLRMERSYTLEKQGEMALAEQDLRWILEREPEHAGALNALGYMLTINSDRFEEALVLIEKAIGLAPKDPAIMDSLGWVYFKLGRIEEAQRELERAYSALPDDEVAAHLIELYWTSDQKKRARKFYRSIKRDDAEMPHVNGVIEALSIPW